MHAKYAIVCYSGGAKVRDQGGKTFSVGRKSSHVVQIGSYLKLCVTLEYLCCRTLV